MKKRRLSPNVPWMAFVAGMVGILAYLLHHGPAVDTDAVTYLSAAESLFHGKGLYAFNGAPVVVWPPLYSLILAGLMFFTGGDVLQAVALSDMLAYGLAAWTAWKLLTLYIAEPRIRRWAFVVYVLGQPLWERFIEAKSEPWFIVWCHLFLWQATLWFRHQDRRHLWGLAAAGMLAVMQRYVGVTLLLAWALIVAFRRREPWARRLRVMVMGGLPAAAVLASWLLYSWQWTGTLGGARAAPFYGVGEWLRTFYHTVCSWVVPSVMRWGTAGQVLVVAAGTIIMGAWKAACVRHWKALTVRFSFFIVWTVLYLAMLLISGTRMWISLPGSRLLSPFFLVWIIGMAALAECLLRRGRPRRRKMWAYVLASLAILHVARAGYSMVQAYRKGLHYHGMASGLLNRWLARYEGPHPVLTTHPERFWYLFPRKRPLPYAFSRVEVLAGPGDTVFILWERPPAWVRPPSLRWAFWEDRPRLEKEYLLERVDSADGEAVYRLVRPQR